MGFFWCYKRTLVHYWDEARRFDQKIVLLLDREWGFHVIGDFGELEGDNDFQELAGVYVEVIGDEVDVVANIGRA